MISSLGPYGFKDFKAPIALAVSGGADSMALAFLAYRWRENIIALVVDHGLRPESACEADQTCARLACMGIPSRLLTLSHLPVGSTQEEARDARFQALEHACVREGAVVLLVAHHAADQEETLMMRYTRSSGLRGMCGIAVRAIRGRIVVVRPLLRIRPERLRQTLRQAGVNWCEDPSNQKLRYLRVNVRQTITSAQRQEMHCKHQCACAQQEKLQEAVAQWLAYYVTWHPEGWVTLKNDAFKADNVEQCVDVGVAQLIKLLSGHFYMPRLSSVQRLKQQGSGSLGGVRLYRRCNARRDYVMMRERRGIEESVPAQTGQRWDQRWRYIGPSKAGYRVDALGEKAFSLREGRDIPADVLFTLPALWCGDEVVAVPLECRGLNKEVSRCSFVWESGVPATGERIFL